MDNLYDIQAEVAKLGLVKLAEEIQEVIYLSRFPDNHQKIMRILKDTEADLVGRIDAELNLEKKTKLQEEWIAWKRVRSAFNKTAKRLVKPADMPRTLRELEQVSSSNKFKEEEGRFAALHLLATNELAKKWQQDIDFTGDGMNWDTPYLTPELIEARAAVEQTELSNALESIREV